MQDFRNLKVWQVADWSLIHTVTNTDFILGVAFSPDDTRLAEARFRERLAPGTLSRLRGTRLSSTTSMYSAPTP